MKRILFCLLPLAIFGCSQPQTKQNTDPGIPLKNSATDTADLTNNFYDNEKTFDLIAGKIGITGEVKNPGFADTRSLPLRSVIVKETLPSDNGNRFVGAYRYDGYSLFDLLNRFVPDKKNQEEFNPIIDLYVVVENAKGEKAVFSWGEIFYPNHPHEIIYATRVMRIVPSKTKEHWPLPVNAKIVAAHDLLTSRNIEAPVKITVVSAGRHFDVEKGMSPMFAPGVDIFIDNDQVMTISKPVPDINNLTYETTFYGRGRGIHSTTPFTGQMIKEILQGQTPVNEETLREVYLIFAAKDGYRGVYTFSEIFNRNDQAEVLLVNEADNKDGGAFKLFPAADFFSDRAIKSVNSIYFEHID